MRNSIDKTDKWRLKEQMEIKAAVDLHLDLRSKGLAANSQQDLIDLHRS